MGVIRLMAARAVDRATGVGVFDALMPDHVAKAQVVQETCRRIAFHAIRTGAGAVTTAFHSMEGRMPL